LVRLFVGILGVGAILIGAALAIYVPWRQRHTLLKRIRLERGGYGDAIVGYFMSTIVSFGIFWLPFVLFATSATSYFSVGEEGFGYTVLAGLVFAGLLLWGLIANFTFVVRVMREKKQDQEKS
jgi:hypothetical protein